MDCHKSTSADSRNDEVVDSTAELESKIDSLVYKLYNLTDSEIKLIESK